MAKIKMTNNNLQNITMAKRKSTKGQTTINKTYTMAIRKGTKGQIAIYKTCKN